MSTNGTHEKDQLSEIFVNLLSACKCNICNGNKYLFYYQECMHAICNDCIKRASFNICPDCQKPSEIQLMTQQSLRIIAKNIILQLARSMENVESTVVFFAPSVFIYKKTCNGETVLHKECRDGNLDDLTEFLKHGADPNEQDFAGWTPLHEAVLKGNLQAAELLLTYGALVNVPAHKRNYETPLFSALTHTKVDMVKFLIQNGAQLDCISDRGYTVFDFCKHDYEMFRVLCLTPRNNINYNVFTLPPPRIALLNVSEDLHNFIAMNDILTVCQLSDLTKSGVVNYLIMENTVADNLYVQFAILQGALLVNRNWCLAYVQKQGKVNPFDYMIRAQGFSFQKAVLNIFYKRPKLFSDIYFHFFIKTKTVVVNNFKYTVADLIALVKAGDGNILKRRPIKREGDMIKYPYHSNKDSNTATTNSYVIYNGPSDSLRESFIEGVRVRSTRWFITCINTFTIISDSI